VPLKKQNVDFGGAIERIAAASIDSPDVFKISLFQPVIDKLEQISKKKYEDHTESMRVIADHLRAATFLAVDGLIPSNKEQGYVMRRLLRRAVRFAFDLGIEQNFLEQVVPVIADIYQADYPEVEANRDQIIEVLIREEKVFRQTLRKGLVEFTKIVGDQLTGETIFKLYDTYGFPVELTHEEAIKSNIAIAEDAEGEFQTDGRTASTIQSR
jgi:alanyl-tRNA synthetase